MVCYEPPFTIEGIMKRRILCVPEIRPGHGTGHIKRCLELVTAIGTSDSGLYMPHIETAAAHIVPEHLRVSEIAGRYELIVIDTRNVDVQLVRKLSEHGMVVGLDAIGSGRQYCDYLIDILPQIRSNVLPNVSEPGFLAQPVRVRGHSPSDLQRILLVFGGEDTIGLSSRMADILVHKVNIEPSRITALIGPAFHSQDFPEGIHCMRGIRNAKELFADYDLVIGQFGLSMFEAAAAGCAVAGIHPTLYHRRLADAAGFFSLGVRRPSVRRLRAIFRDPSRYLSALTAHRVSSKKSLSDYLLQLELPELLGSPVGGRRTNRSILRTPEETFFRCKKTRLIFKQRYAPVDIHYDHTYFSEEYQKQYGRTYAEDFEKIKDMGHKRLAVIDKLLPKKGALLDMGCALGPFLQAAGETGWEPYGIDISEDAALWVREHLELPAVAADVLDFDPEEAFNRDRFEAVSLWYVIEHIHRLGQVFRKINRLLEHDGICAISTPNGSGISARKDFRSFLVDGPPDHMTVFEPQYMQRLFSGYGFHVEKIRITGHHPERFPILGRTRIGRSIAQAISMAAGLGDTFEVYVRKIGEPLI